MPILYGEEAQCAGGAEDNLKNIRKKGIRSNCGNVKMTVLSVHIHISFCANIRAVEPLASIRNL